jgi:hypothetical protein
VGGSFNYQNETAGALKVGTTATYVLRMQNNTGSPAAKKELKVQIRLVSATTCTADCFGYSASGLSGSSTEYAHVVVAA